MFSSAEKTNHSSAVVQNKATENSFFRKAGEESFFGSKEKPAFFSNSIQTKLTVSSPDDPQEKEADAVADQVMRMLGPAVASEEKKEEKLQRKEEEEIQPKEEKEEEKKAQPKFESPQITLQRKEDNEEVQAKLYQAINRSEESGSREAAVAETSEGADYNINQKSTGVYHSDVIQRSGRGPPGGFMQFEQSLSSSKGGGSALNTDTRQFMENRFNADFSGVRIHTGTNAEHLSRSINAQAFAHGNDLYFNSGKYDPGSAAGKTLLAHELTHTIQQGASPAHTSTAISAKTIARKNIIQRSASGVPQQLTNAVEKAKTVEGKIDANKPQPDGNRTGWEHLVEIFKTTFGPEKIISGSGGSAVPGSVAEQDIKKKRMQSGAMIVDKTTVTDRNAIPKTTTGSRDAMPSWCGIFAFWALNKSGVPMPKWKLGERMIKPKSARPPGMLPLPGDIAYRNAYSHFAVVESAGGNTVKTVNGNTAGTDNLGGQVQTIEHPLSNWTAFFNPLLLMQGSLGSGEGPVEEKPKTLRELRRELFNINRKEEADHEEDNNTSPEAVAETVHAKPELSNWHVNETGRLNTQPSIQEPLQRREEEKKEDEDKHAAIATVVQKKQLATLQCKAEPATQQALIMEADPAKAAHENATGCISRQADSIEAGVTQERGRGPPVIQRSIGKKIQCGWFDDALSFVNSTIDYVAEGLEAGKRLILNEARDFVMAIPGYKALRVVLGEDPITGEGVERNGYNFIEAAFDIMPGGRLLHQKLNELGALTDAAAWIDTQIARVTSLVSNIVNRVEQFWNSISLDDLASPTQIFEDAGNIIHNFIQSVIDFAVEAATELLEMVKRFLLTQIVGFIKNHTTAYPLLTVILEKDPITEEHVDRNGANILNALLELGGEEGRQQRAQMQETGTFQKVADWIDRGIAVFGNLYQTIRNNFGLIWEVVSINSLMDPVGTFNRIYDTFADPVRKVWEFVRDTAKIILQFIKEVLLRRLSAWASAQRGYRLVTVLIGKDPFTNERVPRTVPNIIRGFMSLMEGGEEQYQQMEQSGAIARATQQVDAAVRRLNMTPAYIVQLFTDLWNSFSLNDLAHPIEAFQRIITRFGEPISRLIAFVVEIVKIVIRVILEIMNFPFDLINNIITKAMQAFEIIKRDPIAFLKNLLRAVKEGFMQFFDNILTHLFNGLKAWFLSEVQAAGIPIPTDFTVMGIIKWLLAVLDITMEKIWKKLEERIGKPKVDKIKRMIEIGEKVVGAAAEAYAFIEDVQRRGFMAVMIDKIKEQLSNVWEMVLDAVKGFVMDQIIKKVTAKLLTMLDPTGIMAVVNSAIALYKAIQSFIRYLRQMLEIVNSFVEGTLQIAQGATKIAADFLERALARGIPIVIGFLANQVGLNLSERLRDALEIVREKVDKVLTWVIDKVVVIVEKIVSFGKAVVEKFLNWWKVKKDFTGGDGKHHELFFQGEGEAAVLIVKSDPTPYTNFLESYEKELGTAASEEVTVDGNKKTKSQVIADAKVIAGNIETEKRKKLAIYSGATEKERETSKAAAIEKLLADLAAVSIPLFGVARDKPKDDEIIIPAGANNNDFATVQEAKMIWKTPKVIGNGSGPTSAKHTIYDKIDYRQKGDGSYYIRGHLINDNVGGPGNWNNMTALSRTANHEHEEKVESKVKAAYDTGAVIRYKVTTSGKQNVKKATAADKDKFTKIADFATALPYLEMITEAESQIPTQLTCEAYTMKKNGDAWADDKPIVNDTISFSVGGYGDYELGKLGGAVTWDLTKLKTEAAAATGTFIQFKTQDKIHENSITLLKPEELAELEKIFKDNERERNKKDELDSINKMMAADDITTWAAFATRAFFDTKDAAYNTVETAFNNKQKALRKKAIDDAMGVAEAAAVGAFKGMTWQAFKIAQKINFKTEGSEGTDITQVETKFRSKQ